MSRLHDLFEKHEDEYLRFERIINPPSNRKDLCAFLLIDKLYPSTSDIVSCAEHDQFWIDPGAANVLDAVATEEDVIFLRRCGTCFNDDEGLYFFT